MFELNPVDKEFLAVMVVGVSFLVVALIRLQQRARLNKIGIVTEGVVIRVEYEGHRKPCYYPVVRFLTPQQKWVTARYNVGTNPSSFTEGETVQLRFDPVDPTCFTITSSYTNSLYWLFVLFGAGLIIYGAI